MYITSLQITISKRFETGSAYIFVYRVGYRKFILYINDLDTGEGILRSMHHL